MDRPVREIATSAVLLAALGYLLWPPGAVYWTALADAVGQPATLGVVAVLAVVGGAAVATYADLPAVSLAIGGVVAFVVGMLLIRFVLGPDSPAHWFLYGAMLVLALVGVGAAERLGSPDATGSDA